MCSNAYEDVPCLLFYVLLQPTKAGASSGDISVNDAGATPNDDSDDTQAIQSAVNSALAQNKARVLFSAGKYVISSRINILNASDLTLEGAVKGNGMLDANDNRQQLPFKVTGLSNGSHTIVVTHSDSKTLRVDGVRVYN